MAYPSASAATTASPGVTKPGRGQFKCFHCRQIFVVKEGDWFAWNNMEVHLCKACDKATKSRPERKTSSDSR